ncbi:MAG: ArsR family transcriptional regulator [Halioglobus sp.]
MTPSTERLVRHFGEMGSRWGFNRTVGQMYALLLLSEQPLCADELAASLAVSRGNVSMGLQELHAWRLLREHRQPGDRKVYFSPAGPILELARRVLEERMRREVAPTLSLLRELLDADAAPAEAHARDTMRDIHDLLETTDRWATEIQTLRNEHVQTLLRWGTGMGKLLELTDRLRGESDRYE